MQVPSTVLQRIVRDYHTISREMEKKREKTSVSDQNIIMVIEYMAITS